MDNVRPDCQNVIVDINLLINLEECLAASDRGVKFRHFEYEWKVEKGAYPVTY